MRSTESSCVGRLRRVHVWKNQPALQHLLRILTILRLETRQPPPSGWVIWIVFGKIGRRNLQFRIGLLE